MGCERESDTKGKTDATENETATNPISFFIIADERLNDGDRLPLGTDDLAETEAGPEPVAAAAAGNRLVEREPDPGRSRPEKIGHGAARAGFFDRPFDGELGARLRRVRLAAAVLRVELVLHNKLLKYLISNVQVPTKHGRNFPKTLLGNKVLINCQFRLHKFC